MRRKDLERRLREASITGELLDLSEANLNAVDASFLVELLTTPPETGVRRGVRLRGAEIATTLDLEAAVLLCPLQLENCKLAAPLNLAEAKAAAVRILGGELPGLNALGLHTRGTFALIGVHATGEVRLLGAHIGGQLDFTAATLRSDSGPALTADGSRVDQGMFCRHGFAATGEVRLPGAHIGGELDFTGATLCNDSGPALIAERLQLDQDLFCSDGFAATGEIRLSGAHIRGGLDFTGATLRHDSGAALTANGLRVDGDMLCRDDFAATGEVSLLGARIAGGLSFTGATVRNDSGRALSADRLQVDGGMSCRDGFATGEVRLPGAHIRGGLDFTGATLRHDAGPALMADGLQVDGNMFCDDGFVATGEIRLLGAHIGGQLNFSGANLRNDSGLALGAVRLQVDGDMFCDEDFVATGGVRLLGARIGGWLDFADGRLVMTGTSIQSERIALDLEDANVRGLRLRFAHVPHGVVDLTEARVGRILDRTYAPGRVWPRCRLRGCRYDALEAESEDVPTAGRLSWLAADPDEYSPQPYEQLSRVYRESGDEQAARRVLIAKQRRREETLWGPARAWSWFLGVTVGYGYRLWLAGLWLIGLAGLGSLLFWRVFDTASGGAGDLTPSKNVDQVAPFQPVIYSADVLLPVVSLGQETSWNAHAAAQWVTAAGTLLGWLLTTAFVAGLVIRRG